MGQTDDTKLRPSDISLLGRDIRNRNNRDFIIAIPF